MDIDICRYDQGVMSALLTAGQVRHTVPPRFGIVLTYGVVRKGLPPGRRGCESSQSRDVAKFCGCGLCKSSVGTRLQPTTLTRRASPGNRVFDRCAVQPMARRLARSSKDDRRWRMHHGRGCHPTNDIVQLRSARRRAHHHRSRKRTQRG